MSLGEVRCAARLARRAPFLSAVVVLVLAGGIAVTTGVFGLVNAVWLRPLPYPDAARLVVVHESHPRLGYASFLPPSVYEALRESPAWADGIGAFAERSFTIGRPGLRAERVRGVSVSPELLQMLGARPLAGRSLRVEDANPGVPAVALVSERFWRRQSGWVPGATTVRLDGVETAIVGVLPYEFRLFNSGFDIFAPLAAASPSDQDARSLLVVGRLASGVTRESAEARLQALASAAPAQFSGRAGRSPNALPRQARETGWTPVLRPLREEMWSDARPAFLLLLAAALLLLALITANVANLLLARSETRRREFAVRLAFGAGRFGIVRQLLVEGLLLAMTAGTVAVLLCLWLQSLLVAAVPEMTDLRFDARVFAFALSVSCLVGLAFGFLPALSVLRHDVLGGLHADAASGAAARSAGRPLAVAQLAAAAALLTGCGFLVRGALGIRATDPGFDTARLLTASVALPPALYPTDAARQALYQQLAARVSRMPGVVSVATTSVLPLDGGIGSLRIEVEGRSSPGDEAMQGSSKIVSASFAPTVGTRMIAGEAFRQGAAGVAMVNRAMARALWKTEPAAIGSRIRLNGGAWRTVVGVVSDVRQVLTVPPAPEVYVPMDASVPAALSLIVRTANDPMGIAPGLGTAVREANPDIALSGVWSMEMIVDGYFPAPFIAAFLGLSLIALFLSALGLYAMIAFRVASRGRELGIRAALGADPRRLLGLILRDGLRLTLLGLLLGGVVGAALGRLLASRFADVKVADPSLALAVAGVLGVVSVAACLLPARRATKVEPVVALRSE